MPSITCLQRIADLEDQLANAEAAASTERAQLLRIIADLRVELDDRRRAWPVVPAGEPEDVDLTDLRAAPRSEMRVACACTGAR